MVIGIGHTDQSLMNGEVREIVQKAIESLHPDGKRVLVIIPDGTRSTPMPMMYSLIEEFLGWRARTLDYLVALGTHPPMNDTQLGKLIGKPVENGRAGASQLYNHLWQNPEDLATVGAIPAQEVDRLSGGLLAQDVDVRLNKLIFNYDQLIICGPVFPHEVVGFSGGNKYFFPGIAGEAIINFTHWLGALLTSSTIIGTSDTPVRAVIDYAASFIDRPKACFALVVDHGELAGLFFGSPEEAWQSAAKLSAQKHIIYVEKPYQKVISILPEMYDDLWTGAKGMYKIEPVVVDGGEIIIYAPRISEVSYTHGKLIDEIGYHCRDYFLMQWEKFKNYPGGVLAHSTHLRGAGAYDPITGIETPRIQVTLATAISPERCARLNLGHLYPDAVNLEAWQNDKESNVLIVPHAGEMLYRLKA